jgi:F420-dependent oxidoreductase-like protein
MKISVGLDTNPSLDKVIERSRALCQIGLTDQWSSQIFGPDTLTVLALVGREVREANFGTAVIPIQPRHPSMLAAQARTVEAAIGGHLSLGVGLSHQVVVEGLWGISFDKPAAYMNEYLTALAPLLRGEAVNVKGERVSAVTPGPVGPRDGGVPSLLVAALGPAMLKIAGRLTDGTCLWMTGPKTVASHIAPTINEAAAAAGRPAPRIVCSLPITVTSNVAAATAKANEEFAIYPTLPSYAAMLEREGATTPADIGLIGSREQVTDQIGKIFDAGATEFAANFVGTPDEREATLGLLSELAKG